MVKRKIITNSILLALEKAVDGYVRFDDFANHHYRYKYGIPELKKSELSLVLKRLRENGLVDLIDDKQLVFRLTDSGKDRALWEKMKMSNEPWDKKWRIVIWDIPEKRRITRDVLRYKLKLLGFQRLQKSVWASKKDCTKILRNFVKQVGIEDWVMVLESSDIGG